MRRLLAAVPFFLCSSVYAQTAWTVHPTSPTADFATIQDAVDGASAGDIVLVEAGLYASFAIDGKGLSVVADEGAEVSVLNAVNGAIVRVENLPAGQSVTLRGLDLAMNDQFFSATIGINLQDNLGSVWIEDTRVSMFQTFAFAEGVCHAIQAVNSASVTLIRCTAEGHVASQGMRISNADVFAFESSFEGGFARQDSITGATLEGGSGVELQSGELFAADSTFTGGEGLDSFPFACAAATKGGDGVVVAGGLFRDRANIVVGGLGGSGLQCSQPDGPTGGGTVLSGGALEQFTEPLRGVTANSPVFEGSVAKQIYQGVPNEAIFTTIGFVLEPASFLSEFVGPSLFTGPTLIRFFGLVNANGMKMKSFTVQELNLDGVTAYFSPAFYDLNTLTFRSGTPASVTLLDSGLQTP